MARPAPPRPRPRESTPAPPPAPVAIRPLPIEPVAIEHVEAIDHVEPIERVEPHVDPTVVQTIPPSFLEESGVRPAAASMNSEVELYEALHLATTSPFLLALKTFGLFVVFVARAAATWLVTHGAERLRAEWKRARSEARGIRSKRP